VLLLRALVSLIAFVFLTLLGSVLALPAGLIDRSGNLVLVLARWWARGVLASAGVQLRVHARVPLDPKRPYVFMANHLSTVDIWAVLVAIPVQFRFIAKKQLGGIPLFGWAMRAGRFIFIDRQNPALARRSIDEAARRIGAGQSVVIFPEGTRSRDGRLGPFKKGGFHLATSSGAAIVPVAISGSRELMPRGSLLIRPGVASIEVGAPIATAGRQGQDKTALVTEVRGCVAEMLGESAVGDSPDGEERTDSAP
jgi:1-acyl-sn-glycerol-3-phosphate acyltransferase